MAGRKKETSDIEILKAVASSPHPVVVTSELEDELDMTRQGIHKRLVDLEEDGLVNSAMKAASRVWWVTDDGRKYIYEA